MKSQNNKLYEFLKATKGNYRNAVLIKCENVDCNIKDCSKNFLFIANFDGTPIIFDVNDFEKCTFESIDTNEIESSLSTIAFKNIYDLWIKWNITNPKKCELFQLK